MAKQANKTTVGLFVVGAIALLVAALIIFGGGKFFQKTDRYVAFFEGSVKGLNVGAPVMFRGVTIGKVDDFQVYYDAQETQFKIPVLITLNKGKVHGIGIEMEVNREQRAEFWQQMLKSGFRAELQLQSLVTGQLGIQLDFYPDSPLKLYGTDGFDLPPDVREIPTIQSGLQQLTKKIEQIPLDQIVEDASAAIKGINKIINSPETAETLRYLKQAIQDARNLVRRIDEKVDPLFAQVDQTLKDSQALLENVDRQVDPLAASLKQTSDDTRKLVNNVNSRIEPIQAEWSKTAREPRAALNAAEGTLESIDGMVDETSEFRFQVEQFLGEITMMARSLRAFADYLERNPDALLRGKIGREGQK
ncbi:MAG: MCE family protein [Deltaproteobacteria bacterium]|jgi:paraquat-inducible protein B|nr:MCE family protein [Deltaproteobacteria bacterium]